MQTEAIEIRCNFDHALLFVVRGVDKGEIEIVCRKCKKRSVIKFPVSKEAK